MLLLFYLIVKNFKVKYFNKYEMQKSISHWVKGRGSAENFDCPCGILRCSIHKMESAVPIWLVWQSSLCCKPG